MASPEPFLADAADLVWNFAYGSNMNDGVLKQRRGIKTAASRPGVLREYALTFDLAGIPFQEPGFGTVEPCAGGVVHGVAHQACTPQIICMQSVSIIIYFTNSLMLLIESPPLSRR